MIVTRAGKLSQFLFFLFLFFDVLEFDFVGIVGVVCAFFRDCDVVISLLQLIGLHIETSKVDEYSEYIVSGIANLDRVRLIDNHFGLIAQIASSYDKDKVSTLLEHKHEVFDLVLADLGIDLNKAKKSQQPLSHDSGIYDENWIIFALHKIVSEVRDESLGIYDCTCCLCCLVVWCCMVVSYCFVLFTC